MPAEIEAEAVERLTKEMTEALPTSAALFEKARSVVPGGTTRARFWWPVPVFIRSGQGARATDVDGREYIDCNLGFGPLILGHGHPAVTQAIHDQVDRGVLFGAPNEAKADLGRFVIDNVPGAAKVVFTSSGSEATLGALKLARAATGRQKVAKFEGGWHGGHELLCYSFASTGGPLSHPETIPDTAGVAAAIGETVVVLPYNDTLAFDRIREVADDLACVIVETNQASGGAVAADPQFLAELRDLCAQLGVIFIVDEVITGFRVGASGGAGQYGLEPDLVTLGKIVGGGISAGAVAGSGRILDLAMAAPGRKPVSLGGTHSANPLAMTAGRETLKVLLENPAETFGSLNRLGDYLRNGLRALLDEVGLVGQITGTGSLWGLHFLDEAPNNMRDQAGANTTAARLLSTYLMLEGVLVSAPMHLAFLSTAHTEADADLIVDAHRRSLTRLKTEGWFES
jgi:glutamate-1-semialdehyde 2,1-aminomutase